MNRRRALEVRTRRETIVLWSLTSMLLLSLGCASSKSSSGTPGDGATPAAGTVLVKVGKDAADSVSHDVSLDALRAGQGVFSVEGEQGALYTVELTEEQIADLLSGSTIMVEGAGDRGAEQIRLSVKKASKKRFLGW